VNKKHRLLLMLVMALIYTSLACKTLSGDEPKPETADVPLQLKETITVPMPPTLVESIPTNIDVAEPVSIDSEFPLPGDGQDFVKQGDGEINYQTGMALEEVIEFYRQSFSARGLAEREMLTIINEDVFNIVFDGAPNGKAVVVQGVRLDNGSVNVNIRYEDL